LIAVQEGDLKNLPKHIRDWRVPNAAEADQVRIPLMSLRRLKAMRYWALGQTYLGLIPNATSFTPAVLTESLASMRDDDDYKAARKEADIQKPTLLTDLAKWTTFWELFVTYFSRLKGAANTPLTYLVREHGEVTPEIRAAAYASDVDRHIATTVHEGRHFDLDNTTLYDELKSLVVDGPGWAFVRRFDRTKNGRAAVLALKAQAEGVSSKLTRKAKAYASITNAVYRGLRRGYTFANYVTTHQEAHNELFDLEEPVSESKKVTDFLKGIQDPSLQVGKTVILSDPAKLGDFDECQQYFSTLIQNTSTQAKAERNVSSVRTNGGGGGSPNASLVDKIKGGTYTDAQFKSLTKEEKDRVTQYRGDSQRKKGRKQKQKTSKRRLAKAQSAREESADAESDEETQATSGAGSQFGANGNRSKKTKH
jgi:hypothetical protein